MAFWEFGIWSWGRNLSCHLTSSTAQMPMHNCQCTTANAQMHKCQCTNAQMSMHKCQCTTANAQMPLTFSICNFVDGVGTCATGVVIWTPHNNKTQFTKSMISSNCKTNTDQECLGSQRWHACWSECEGYRQTSCAGRCQRPAVKRACTTWQSKTNKHK